MFHTFQNGSDVLTLPFNLILSYFAFWFIECYIVWCLIWWSFFLVYTCCFSISLSTK